LTGDRLTAFFCALIFALYPAHVENVAWVSGVTDSLVTCFLLSSFLLLVGSPVTGVRRIGSLILFVLALLSKETAVILPVLVFVYGAVAEKGTDSRQSSSFAAARRISLPYVLVLLTYGVVRYLVLHGWSHATVSLRWNQVLLTWPSVLWFYVRHLCLPFRTSEFYSLDYVGAFSWPVVLPLLLVAFAASLIWLLMRAIAKKDESYKVAMLISVSLIVLPLIPVLDLRSLTAGDIVHDRYLYLPSVGFALLSAISIRALFQKRFAAQLVFMGMMTVFFAAIVVHEQMQWADDIALYTRGIQSAPNNLTVRDNLANALLDKHPEKSLSLYAEVLKRNPRFWRTNYNLGVAYYKLAEYPAAEGQLQQAIQVDSEDADQYIYLALTETRLQKLREAKKDAEMAIARNPNGRGYHAVLGMICEAAADRTTAMEEFKSELAAHPDNASAAAALEKLEQGSGPQR
jgi:hypothetical protein